MKAIMIIPPVWLFLSIVIMVLLHFLAPIARVFEFPWRLLGILPLGLGIAINLLADREFKRHMTAVKPLEESTALISTGVFQLSRHPMYLGFVLILLGIASLAGSLSPYGVVLAFAFFMDIVFIRHEERDLEKSFGRDWLDYRDKARRWI